MNSKKISSYLFLLVFITGLGSAQAAPNTPKPTLKQNAQSKKAQAAAKQKTAKKPTATESAQLQAAYTRLLAMDSSADEKQNSSKKPTTPKKPSELEPPQPPGKSTPETAAVSDKDYSKRLRVTATAYTSHVNQTDSTPTIAAWGDKLKPGMKAIAVSRDLLNDYGLKHKQKVRIKGLKGEYVVLDKMNKRWRKKIDIYMGMNKRKALRWGRRKVEILWNS